jgi:outer membrane receptor protein involved in Fe transport
MSPKRSPALYRLANALGALLLVLAFLGRGANVRADDLADEAELQFQRGNESYESKDYKGALEHYLASNRLVPNRSVLYNIALTYEKLGQAPEAYRYYNDALEQETRPERRKNIEDGLARVSPSVAVLRVTTDPPGATIYLDRKDLGPRGTTPRALGLPAGKRKLIVELSGYEPQEQENVELKVGQEVKINLSLVAILGTVKVEGDAPGATVKLDSEDGKVLCTTVPCTAMVPPGRHILVVQKPGYANADVPVDVPPKGNLTARVNLSAQTGTVVVNTDLRDALITIDDKPSGFTPAVLAVPVGKHRLRVTLSGFRPIEQVIEVEKAKEVKLDLQLTTQEEVTAASRVTEAVEDAPASVSIITSQELRAMGYPTLAEAIRGIRGIYLSNDTSYDSIGVRGFARPGDYGNRVLITIDGHPANDNYIWSSYPGFDGRVDIDDIDRIEVVRGPGSVLYGTSAFFAVINLVTRSRDQPSHVEAKVDTVLNAGRARATAYWRIAPDAGVWTSVAGAKGWGTDHYFEELRYDPNDPNAPKDAFGKPYDGWARKVDDFTSGMVNGRAWWKSLTLQWFLNSRIKTLPSTEYGTILNDSRSHFADTRGFLELRFEPQLTSAVQLLARAHVNMYDFDGFNAYPTWQQSGGTTTGSSSDTYRGRWGGAEARVFLTPSESFRLTVGGEFIQHFQTLQQGLDDVGPYVFDDKGNPGRNDPFSVGAGYVNADILPVKAFKISAGARLDYYSSLDKFNFLDAFNPRLAFIVKPYQGGTLKLLAGKAFRAPSVYELYYTSSTQLRPTGLKPEQVYSAEIEYDHRFSTTVVASAAAFINGVSNLIELNNVLDASGTQRNQYRNSLFPVLVTGGEAEIRREWRQGWMFGASVTVQYAQYLNKEEVLTGVTGSACTDVGGTVEGGNCRAVAVRDVPNSPRVLGSIRGAFPIIGRTLMVMSRLSFEGGRPDGQYRNYDTSGGTPTAAPAQGSTVPGLIWDLVFSGEIERAGLRYSVGAYNVLGWQYDTVPSGEFVQRTIMQPGRSFLASLAFTY